MSGRELPFAPVVTNRIYEEIVSQVRAAVRRGDLKPGDRLPSERELAGQFGASRVTVRDALRILEANGLIEIRVGARGGSFIRTPEADVFGEGLTDLMFLSELSPPEVTEARTVLELAVLPLVVKRATDADLANLDRLCEQAEEAIADGRPVLELSTRFHSDLLRSAHNGALDLLAQTFQAPLMSSLRVAYAADPVMGAPGWREHRDIVEKVRERDLPGATRIMAAHLDRTATRLKRRDG